MRQRKFWTILAIVFCMNMLVPLLSPVSAFAAADPITVSNETSKPAFPKSINFSMTANDNGGNITQATLFILYNGSNQDLHQINASTPSSTVNFHWQEDTSSDNFAPTGTQVSYYWKVQDDSGHTYVDKTLTFTMLDSRYQWQELNNGTVDLHWYDRPTSFGQSILNTATQDAKKIDDDLGNTASHPVSLWIYKSNGDFQGSLPSNEYEWVGGIAFPQYEICEISVESLQDDTLVRDMPHELTHLLFHQVVGNDDMVPTWFNEGLAVYHQLYHEPEMKLMFDSAVKDHSLLRLASISTNFPADTNKAYLAYAESWQLVDYMYRTFGHDKMIALFNAIKSPQYDFGEDLQKALGMDQLHLENQWYLSLKLPPLLQSEQTPTPQPASHSPITVNATDSNTPWMLLLGLLLVILPGSGLVYLFVYQKRSREKALVLQQAQQILHTTFPGPQGPLYPQQPPRFQPGSSLPYTDPRSYGAAEQPQRPYAPYSQQVPYTPPVQPHGVQPPIPETPRPQQGNNGVPGQHDEQHIQEQPNQEYLNRYPNKQAPQE